MYNLNDYEQKLLDAWEEIYKRGQLTMWIMLSLKDGPKRMSDIKSFIDVATNGTLYADDKSMYRALRRYYDAEMVDYSPIKGEGPDVKIYRLTKIGSNVLRSFLSRNIIKTLFKEENAKLIKNGESR